MGGRAALNMKGCAVHWKEGQTVLGKGRISDGWHCRDLSSFPVFSTHLHLLTFLLSPSRLTASSPAGFLEGQQAWPEWPGTVVELSLAIKWGHPLLLSGQSVGLAASRTHSSAICT